MLIAALFIIAKLWRQAKYLLTDEWINKKCGIYIQLNIIQPENEGNSDTCYRIGGLEAIMPSETCQLKNTNTLWFHLYELQRVDRTGDSN